LLINFIENSTNVAVLSELGRFPLHFNVIKAMIRYYDRLKKIEKMFPLLHAAYKESISIGVVEKVIFKIYKYPFLFISFVYI
jgi:hypothetical protein